MFLEQGEPFHLLVGIPLAGAPDRPLGGALAVFERSHVLIGEALTGPHAALPHGPHEKAEKLRALYR